MMLPRAARALVAITALGGLTVLAQPPKTAAPPIAADEEPLLFNNQPTVIAMNGLRGWACAVSGDGKTLVTCAGTGEQAGEIVVWNLADGKVRRTIRNATGVRSVAISPDNKTVAAGCYGGAVRLFDLANGELKAVGTAHTV